MGALMDPLVGTFVGPLAGQGSLCLLCASPMGRMSQTGGLQEGIAPQKIGNWRNTVSRVLLPRRELGQRLRGGAKRIA